MYTYKQIANYFITKAINEKAPVTPMKLQKLLYFAHGWYLGIFQKPLLAEPIEAWKYGPVIPSLYQDLKQYRNSMVLAPINDCTCGMATIPEIPEEDTETKEFLNKIWEVYKPYDAIVLSNATHQNGSPWELAWKNNSTYINNDLIQNYFANLSKSPNE